jgi:hypothetical protein
MKTRFLLALLILPATLVFAEDEDFIPQDSLKRVEYEVALRTQRAVNKQLNRVIFAEELGWTPPIHPPKLTFDQVYARIEEVVEMEANKDKNFPKSFYEKIKIEAKERYRMWRHGDNGEKVSVTVRIHGQNKVHSGILRAKTRDRIIVGSTPFAKQDLSKEDLTHLYWEEHESAINRYVRIQTEKFEFARNEFKENERKKEGAKEWPKFGFIYNRGPKVWQSRAGAFEKMYQRKFDELYKSLSEEIANSVYAEFGFTFDETAQQWMFKGSGPSEEELANQRTKSLLNRFKALFSKEEADPIDEQLGLEAPTAPKEEDSLWEDDVESGERPVRAPAEGATEAPTEGGTAATQNSEGATGPPAVENVDDLYDENY